MSADATQAHRFLERIEALPSSSTDPNPWLALHLDPSLPMNREAKAALVLDTRSFSRQFILPLVRPFARLAIVLVQLLKLFLPRRFAAPRLLHALIAWGLEWWVSPEANFLILRHFHVGTEILGFLRTNLAPSLPATPLRPTKLRDLVGGLFVQHDVNLFNFVIELSRTLEAEGRTLAPVAALDFSAVTDGPFGIGPFQRRWTNFLDLASAIELYTPLYQLLLSDDDFWRASNSLQLDETVALYVGRLLGDTSHLGLVNNRHPLVPLSTMRAAPRLLLHGLAAESLHGLLVGLKRK